LASRDLGENRNATPFGYWGVCPPVKTGGFPAVGGRRGLRPLGKIQGSLRFASINNRSFTCEEKDWPWQNREKCGALRG